MGNVPDSPFKRATAATPTWIGWGMLASVLVLVGLVTYSAVMVAIGLQGVDLKCLTN